MKLKLDISNALGSLSQRISKDPFSPTTYGLPDLLSFKDRPEREKAIKEFVEGHLYLIKKGRKVPIKLVPEMIRFITDMFYGYKDAAILWKPRGSGGSAIVGIVIWLKAIYQKMAFYILAGSGDQSEHIYDYVKGFFLCYPVLVTNILKSKPLKEKIEFKNGVEIRHITASEASVIGEHVPGIAVDEASTKDPKFEKLIKRALPIVEDANPKCIMMCSTFHTPSGTFQETWDDSEERQFERYRYDVFDVMEKCVEPIECKNCYLTNKEIILDQATKSQTMFYTGCNGKARNGTGFRSFQNVFDAKKRNKPTGVWEPEFECIRPGEGHHIYKLAEINNCIVSDFEVDVRKITQFCVGIDWGYSHMTAVVFIAMMDGNACVLNAMYFTETLVPQISIFIENEIEKYGFKKHQILVYADAENQFNNGEMVTLGYDTQPVPFGQYKVFAIGNVKRWMEAKRLKMLRYYPMGDDLYKQLKGYTKSPETDKPVKKNDHFPDALAAGMLAFNYLEYGIYDDRDMMEEHPLAITIIGR